MLPATVGSGCAPGKCAMPDGTQPPVWCGSTAFDPEGLVSSLNAILTTVLGVHFGHVLIHVSEPRKRLLHWAGLSGAMLVLGLALHYGGIRMNTCDRVPEAYSCILIEYASCSEVQRYVQG